LTQMGKPRLQGFQTITCNLNGTPKPALDAWDEYRKSP